mgnify:CR=1 FL=1
MRKLRNAMMATAVLAAGTRGSPLFAQGDTQQEGMEANGMHGDMMEDGNMMGMMGQMNSMMDKCDAMMEKMQAGKESDTND